MLECRASVSSRAKPLGVVSVRFQAASTITTNFVDQGLYANTCENECN